MTDSFLILSRTSEDTNCGVRPNIDQERSSWTSKLVGGVGLSKVGDRLVPHTGGAKISFLPFQARMPDCDGQAGHVLDDHDKEFGRALILSGSMIDSCQILSRAKGHKISAGRKIPLMRDETTTLSPGCLRGR